MYGVNEIEKDAINIEIYLETTVTKYFEYKKFYNKINLILLNILESQGVKLSYPGRNIYIKEEKKEDKKGIKPAKIIK